MGATSKHGPGTMRRLLATLVLAALLAGAALAALRYYSVVLARSWGSQLAEMPEDQVAAVVRRIARLGEPGIPELVQALGSDRDAVGYWAKEAIQEEIDSWKELPANQATSRWTALADALATQTGHFAPVGRARAADLATYVLRGHRGSDPALPFEVVAACERLLWLEAADREAEARAKRQSPLLAAGTNHFDGTGNPAEAASLPPPLASQSAAPPAVEPRPPHGPARLTENSPDRPFSLRAGTSPPGSDAGEAEAASESDGDSVANKPGRVSSMRPLAFSEALSPAKGTSVAAPAWSEAVDVMRRLHAADAEVAADARARLARWGFSPVQKEVAKRMFHPDAAVRKELAQALPGIAGLDAAPWLIQLAGDENAEVRLAAISLLLTTSDPALVQRARRLADADPDPRIRDQVQRAGASNPRAESPAGTARPSTR